MYLEDSEQINAGASGSAGFVNAAQVATTSTTGWAISITGAGSAATTGSVSNATGADLAASAGSSTWRSCSGVGTRPAARASGR
ncbi:hypothetical protein [Hymenobacter cheonanensis]|uniref:hypothetical protein n=1 Tax=Hymenobacter sp. CA2-7 TaxID=3063993 RepID=UPI00272D208D|nr:hypothetical protein [Hymenobacter sp. CA2-7]